MASNKGEGSSSSASEKDDHQMIQVALQQISDLEQQLQQGMGELVAMKGKDLEKSTVLSAEESRAKYLDRLSELGNLIAKQQSIEAEILRTMEKMLGGFKRSTDRFNEEAKAERERRREMMQSDFAGMISDMSEAARQVSEKEDEKDP